MDSKRLTLVTFALVPVLALLLAGYMALQYHWVSLFLVIPAVLALVFIAYLALSNTRANGGRWYKYDGNESLLGYSVRVLLNAAALVIITAFGIFTALYILDMINNPENHVPDSRVFLNSIVIIVGLSLVQFFILKRKRG